MLSIRCLFGCYSSTIQQPNEEQLSSIIIKDLLIDVLNEFEKYTPNLGKTFLCTDQVNLGATEERMIPSNKNISIKSFNETDEIMDGLREILQELTIIKEEIDNKSNTKKNDS